MGGFLGTIVLLVGAVFWLSSTGSAKGLDPHTANVEAQGITVSPESLIDLGQIPYSGGKVLKSFEIKNDSGRPLKLKKIATSCMCTTAKVEIGGKKTKEFGMEMNGDLNPLVDVDFPAGQTGTVTFSFDPTAHGPEGVGQFERVVTLFFDSGFKELKFEGTVVN